MSCSIEFFIEVFLEGTIELIGYCYIKLMQLIIPNKTASEKAKRVIKGVATTIAALLAFSLIVGLILLMPNNPAVKAVGKYIIYVSLTMIALQIVAGIVVKIVNHCKK